MIQPVLSALAGKRQAGERQAKLQQLVAFSSVRRPAMYRKMLCSQSKIIVENTPKYAHHGRHVLQPPPYHIKYSTWKAHYELVQHTIYPAPSPLH